MIVLSSVHNQLIMNSSSIHHQFIISLSSAHHQLIISSSSAHHQFIIRSSSVHHLFIIRSSSVRHKFKLGPHNIPHFGLRAEGAKANITGSIYLTISKYNCSHQLYSLCSNHSIGQLWPIMFLMSR